MNVLLIDFEGCALDIAWRAAESGHAVKLCLPVEAGKKFYEGTGFPGVEVVSAWKPHMNWAKHGVILNMYNDKAMHELDKYRAFGFPVFGPTYASAQLEIDRKLGMQAFKDAGIEVAPYKTFTSLADAEAYAWKAQDRLVFKVMGNETDKSLSYCSHSPADMVDVLQQWQRQGMKLKGECMLQEFVEGIEMGVSGWMGPQGFCEEKWNENFEFKKLMSGEYGPSTGEMGSCLKYCKISKLADEMLRPLEKTLLKLGHRGDFDMNVIIPKSGTPMPCEPTVRFGYPAWQIMTACHKGDPVLWMADLLKGKDTLEVSYEVALGILMAQPPFPKDGDQKAIGTLISGIEEVWDHVSPWQMMLDKGPVMKDGKVTTGAVYRATGEYVCVVHALGQDVHDVIPQAYETVSRIKFKNRMVRDDVGKKLEHQLPKLHALGYAESITW